MLMDSEIFKHIPNPEPSTERRLAKIRAKAGEMPATQQACPHPISAAMQLVDEKLGRAQIQTNLFQCGVCRAMMFLVDGTGKEASDA